MYVVTYIFVAKVLWFCANTCISNIRRCENCICNLLDTIKTCISLQLLTINKSDLVWFILIWLKIKQNYNMKPKHAIWCVIIVVCFLQMFGRLRGLRDRRELCDVTVHLEGAALSAHGAILAAWSPRLAREILGKMITRFQSQFVLLTYEYELFLFLLCIIKIIMLIKMITRF